MDDRGPQSRALVLVVVDDAGLLRMITKVLETEYRTASAINCDEGLVQAMAHRPDLIVSDIRTPLTVSNLLQAVRRQADLTDIPFLLLMDGAAEADRLHSSRNGTDDYLSKPFSLSEFRARVAIHVAGKPMATADVA